MRYGALSWPEPEYPEPGLLTIAGVMLDTGQELKTQLSDPNAECQR